MLLAAGLVPVMTPRKTPSSSRRRSSHVQSQGLRHRVLRGKLEEVVEDCCLVLMYEDAERARVQTPPATPPPPTLQPPPRASLTQQAAVPVGTGFTDCSEMTLFARPPSGATGSLLFPALYMVAAPAAAPIEEGPAAEPESAPAAPAAPAGVAESECGMLDYTEATVLCGALVEEEEDLPEKPEEGRIMERKSTLGSSVATTAALPRLPLPLRSGPARGGC